MPQAVPKYQTARTRALRSTELDPREDRTISNIERFGCTIFHIDDPSKDRPLFSFTVGVYDTCGQPEIITTGLLESTAHSLLNSAATELRNGVNLAQGRHRDLIGEVECEFRPVAPKWIKHLMGWALWYYDGSDFPVLQAVYPDTNNRFPGEEGFQEYFTQPLLQADAPQTVVEDDFWAANDPKSSLFDWKFPDPPHTNAYLSETVNSGAEPVTYVSHDQEDGAWQFLGDSMSDGGGPVLVCLHHPLDNDPTLKELFDLPQGWYAERTTPSQPWLRREQPPEEPSEDE